MRLEASTAQAIRPLVRDFDRKYGRKGTIGQVDIETNKFVIEVTGGTWADKMEQIERLKQPNINKSGKPVIVFAPGWNGKQVRGFAKQGVPVFRDLDELKKYLREHGEKI